MHSRQAVVWRRRWLSLGLGLSLAALGPIGGVALADDPPAVPPAVFLPAPLTVSGQAIVGQDLQASLGAFSPPLPQRLSLRWTRDGQAIVGARFTTYTVKAADLGHALAVRITAAGTGYTTLQYSVAAPTVHKGSFRQIKPKIVGKTRIGVRLTVKLPSYGDVEPKELTYQWYRSGKRIRGATAKTYLIAEQDTGRKISVRVVGRRDGYKTVIAKSAKTGRVPKMPDLVDERCMTSGMVLCVDKAPTDRKVRLLVDGKIKMTLDARFGASATPSREGVFSVYFKSADHWSTLYNTSMPYAMFFSGGQAVHYSPDFAARGYNGASHGCINTRDRAAISKLFNLVKIGTKVVVYH